MEWMDFSGVDNREIDILENSMMFVDLWELLDVYFSMCVYSDVCNTILLFPRLEIMPFWIIPPINHHPSDVAVSIYIYIYIRKMI